MPRYPSNNSPSRPNQQSVPPRTAQPRSGSKSGARIAVPSNGRYLPTVQTLGRATLATLLSTLLASLLHGCAGAGFSDFSRSAGGDVSNGYNSSLAGGGVGKNGGASSVGRGSFPMIATAFQLTNLPGDPFDFERVNVQVTLRRPDNSTVEVPAFYDGDTTWRMRYTPSVVGTYAVVNVKLNGQIAHEERLEKKDWAVNGQPEPGFVRLDHGDRTRFVFDNGGRYYPLGHNQAWRTDKLPDIPELFVKMHDSGENWSRVWMDHWDNKNLDWNIGKLTSHSTVSGTDTTPATPATTAAPATTTSTTPAPTTLPATTIPGTPSTTTAPMPTTPGTAATTNAPATTTPGAPATTNPATTTTPGTPATADPAKPADVAKTTTKETAGTKSKLKLGEIDLEAARRWDTIVSAAQKSGIYFQLVLQHHGQYSTTVDSNWAENPYNVKNGGFLKTPDEFFTNPQARALTKRKLYYMVSRWGYSPNILAWELFNEVQFTDAGKSKLNDQIALWHREMALFLRQFDGYRHLLTTSSAPAIAYDSQVWETVDYVQTHTYPTDVLTALGGTETPATYGLGEGTVTKKAARKSAHSDRAGFVGEFGPANLIDEEGIALHQGLWASLMHNGTGAAEYWDWATVEKYDLYSHFKSVSSFLANSGLTNHGALVDTTLPVECSQSTALRFGPGGGYSKSTQDEFVVGKDGAPQGMDQYPTFLQGTEHRDMMPKPLTLHVTYPQAGTFTLSIDKIAKAGAHLKVTVDGKATERDFAAGQNDYAPKAAQQTVEVPVGQGAHDITVENTGKDWLVVKQFALSNYTSALAANARVGKDFAVAWVYHRGNIYESHSRESGLEGAMGKVMLTGLQPGNYRYTWWDTYSGKSIEANDLTVGKTKDGVQITTPSIKFDAALYVTKAGPMPKLKTFKPAQVNKTASK